MLYPGQEMLWTETDRQTDRQTNQTDRQTDRQTRQTDQTDRQRQSALVLFPSPCCGGGLKIIFCCHINKLQIVVIEGNVVNKS